MKKKFYTAILAILSAIGTLHAQNFQWAKLLTGPDDVRASGVVADAQGNVFVVGNFYATADFDPGPGTFNMTALGASDVFLVKLNAIGGFVWAKQFSGTGYEYGQGVAVDASGNPHIISTFYNTVDYDPGPATLNFTANTYSDIAVVKLDPNGNLIWAKQFAGTDYDTGRAIAVDAAGSVYTTGHFIYTCDFDPGTGVANLTANGTISDVFVSKLDINGNYVWAKRLGGPWSEYGYGITVTPAAEVIVVGQFEGTADFDPGAGTFNMTTSAYQPEAFCCKLSATGALVWAKDMDTGSYTYCFGVGLDASGNVYTCGTFIATTDFDPGAGTYNITANNGSDAYLLKLSSAGAFVWAKAISGSLSAESIRSLSVTSSGVYYTGYFDGTVDFNPGAATYNLTAAGNQDICVGKLDLNGNFVSAFRIGNASNTNNGFSIYATNAGNVYTVGLANGTSDFDPGAGTTNLSAVGLSDAFVQKLSLCTATSATSAVTACGSYTIGGTTYTTSGSYTARIPNAAGCDSVITLNLTIRQPSTFTLTQNLCATSYTLNAQTYTSSGTYTQHLTNAVGCDSAITLNLTLRQPSASTLTQNLCATSYTLNAQTYTSSGTYTQHLTNAVGCDSAITLNLTLRQPSAATLTQTGCSSITVNNQTYTSSGTYTQTLTNAQGCDSVLTLNLTVNAPSSATLTQSACGSFTLNNQTYNSSGTYTQTLTNAQGCDSILTLQLTVNSPSAATLTQTACSSYTLNNQTYSSSGIYTQTLTNSQGCDSTLTLDLTITQPSSENLTVDACDAYTLNAQTYSSSGTYVQTLTNAQGCDSTLTLVLTLTSTPAATISQGNGALHAGPGGMTYQWVDCDNGMNPVPGANGASFTPTSTGNYAVIVQNGSCSDTSACESFTVLGVASPTALGFSIHPNPTSGAFMLTLDHALVEGVVEVHDLCGKLLFQTHLHQVQSLPITLEVPTGVYLVTVTTEEGRMTRKLVRE